MSESLDPSVAIKQYHQALIVQFKNQLTIYKDELDEDDTVFTQLLDALCEDINTADGEVPTGQKFISTMVARYPQLTPRLPRDLFWYFGGDCLHYVEDKELENFQALEEAFYNLASTTPITEQSYARLRESFFAATPINK